MTPTEIIRATLSEFLVEGRRYHSPLPPNLEQWYCYCSDGGHSIVCLLDGQIEPGELWNQTVPVPVKAVLRAGWRTLVGDDGNTYVVTAAEYSPTLGLITAPEDDEF